VHVNYGEHGLAVSLDFLVTKVLKISDSSFVSQGMVKINSFQISKC